MSVASHGIKLHELVAREAIVAELSATSRSGAIRELVERLAQAGQILAESVEGTVRQIVARERSRGSTGFGKGVAIPHAKLSELTRVVAAVGRSTTGVDFAALDGAPVHAIFLILSPEANAETHLRAMDVVFRVLQQERFRKFFRQSDTPEKIHDLLKEADEQAFSA